MRFDDPISLLSTYAVALHGLRSHGVIRSFNSPVGDIAEWMVSKKLQLTLTPMSNRSHDATDASGARYQIKARWCPSRNRSMQLGAVRDLLSNPFEFLVAVVFDRDFMVDFCCDSAVDSPAAQQICCADKLAPIEFSKKCIAPAGRAGYHGRASDLATDRR